MRFPNFILSVLLWGSMAAAQEIVVTPLDEESPLQPLDELIGELTTIPNDFGPTTQAPRIEVAQGLGGELRVLDKLTGAVADLTLNEGELAELGFLSVALRECRYPIDNPSGDAFAYVVVSDRQENTDLFSGWILASAPALNAMDHPRYDVWALRCTTSTADDT